MFAFGREARERREAVKIISMALREGDDLKAFVRSGLGVPSQPKPATSHSSLAEQLMARVTRWPTRRFAGHVLPNPSAIGLAMEALSYGVDDLSDRLTDQQEVIGALGRVLAFAAKHEDRLNDADYELFQVLGRRFVNHPLVKDRPEAA